MALDLLPNYYSMAIKAPPPAHISHPHLDLDLDLYGDILEAVVTHVPTIDLIPASRVSRDWHTAVRSSLRRHPRRSPWLLLRHCRHPSSPHSSLHAFDPYSSSWLSLPSNSTPSNSSSSHTIIKPDAPMTFLCSSAGDRLHTLSISKIAISSDPFATSWRKEAKAPKVWRQDAVVAEVGRWVVVAGGGCPMVLDEGEVVGAVEVYDKHAGTWESAEPMPPGFDGSTSATWLSVAASDEKLFVMEKKTGLVSSFDPNTKRWGPACQLRRDPTALSWAVAIGRNERVLVVGLGPERQSVTEVRLWEVNLGTMHEEEEEMPKEMVERLFPREEEGEEEDDDAWGWQSRSIEVCGTERGGYVYNPSAMRNGAVMYEFAVAESKGRRIVGRWEWVPLPESVGVSGMDRIHFGCSAVGLDELACFWTR